jgi:hypothetical protein
MLLRGRLWIYGTAVFQAWVESTNEHSLEFSRPTETRLKTGQPFFRVGWNDLLFIQRTMM